MHSNRIQILEPLRGLAALGVCLFHFTNGGNINTIEALKNFGSYGWLGVEIFFVISGFIIPLSMYRAGYKLGNNSVKFIIKRIIRLDPPYIVSLIIVIILMYASSIMPGFAGQKPDLDAIQILLHLGYLNAFFDYFWLNPVYWTLAIEFQYYLLIAIMYPILVNANYYLRNGLILLLFIAPLSISSERYIIHYLALFGLGIVSFQFYINIIDKRTLFIYLFIFSVFGYFSLGKIGVTIGLITALIILFVRVNSSKPFVFLGSISYSLYLIHVPIGGRVVNLGGRFADTFFEQIIVFLAALAVSITAAYIIFLLVERPAQKWSGRIKYEHKQQKKPVIS